MINFLKQYEGKTFEELVNSLIWFDNPQKLKAIFSKFNSEIKPYKAYIALMNQSGSSDPTIIELENSLGNITVDTVSAGIYNIYSDGLFKTDKTYIQLAPGGANVGVFSYIKDDESLITTNYNDVIDGSPIDPDGEFSLEIRVYN